ncbi:GNAT family N-acetyltransferase [Salinispora vitiensis]|nr:GNAT family protein [Salinispora vitiensis]
MERNQYGQQVGAPVPHWSTRPLPGRGTLAGRYVTAEPISLRHADALFAAVCGPGNGALWTYRPVPQPESIAEFEKGVLRPLAEHAECTSFAFVPAGDRASGLATLSSCAPEAGVVEISGVLWGRSMRRSTAATEAIHLMLRYVFQQLGYRRVEWKCDSRNEPSARAAQRLGFTYEGRFRQHMIVRGRNRDTDWYSMLDTEWPAIRARNERWLDPRNFDQNGHQLQRLEEI